MPEEGISMRIGFMGAGIVAQTISKHVLAVGHRVLLSNTRDPNSLARLVKELGPGEEAGVPQQAAEQDLVVLAKVVKAFNSVPMSWISDFSPSKPRTVLFISGDDAEAKKPVNDLIGQIGLECVDLGSLTVGGRLQQLGGPLAGIRLTFIERFTL
jgi:predicted dinucleotide-binding enzyme